MSDNCCNPVTNTHYTPTGCFCTAEGSPAELPTSHRAEGSLQSREAFWGTCRSGWEVFCREYRTPRGPWRSSCWGSCWSWRTGHSLGPRSCWGSPWSRCPPCPSPGTRVQLELLEWQTRRLLLNTLIYHQTTSTREHWEFLQRYYFLRLFTQHHFPCWTVQSCWGFRWSRQAESRYKLRRPEMWEMIRITSSELFQ